MTRPRCSIIIVTYNHRQHIGQCLRSVLSTTGSGDRVMVVDNASSDGTPEYVSKAFPMVELVANTENRGFGAACNQMAHQAEGKHLVFLNPDTEALAGWLDSLLAALDSGPPVGLATPKLLLRANPEVIDSFGHDVHISGIATCRGWGQPAATHPYLEQVAAISGACFAIRRDLFDRLKGFDERLFLYYEDDDLSLRARLVGYTCVAVPQSQVLHDHRPGFAPDKLRYLERNRLWTTLKLYRPSTLGALLPVIVGAEILAWGMAAICGPPYLMAKLWAWLELARWMGGLANERRRVERSVTDRALLVAHTPKIAFGQVAAGPFSRRAERMAAAAFARLAPG